MSYDLSVFTPALPGDLRAAWQAALRDVGLSCEIDPDFDPADQSGYLAWKFQVTDKDVFRTASLYPAHAVDAGFELAIRPAAIDLADWKTAAPEVVKRLSKAKHELAFSTSHGCSPEDFRLQWFAAATLAQLTGGVLHDPQEERSFLGEATLAEAEYQANKFEEDQDGDWPETPAFDGW